MACTRFVKVMMTNAKLTYEVEFTRNLGNFENVKPKFGLTVDVDYNSKEDLEVLKTDITNTVDSWLTDKVEELEAELRELGLGKN